MRPSRAALAFLVGLIAGLSGETLLFLERQCGKIEAALGDDFRVVCFLKAEPDAGREKVLEEQLRGMPGVEDVRYVSRQEALASLRREEPELVEAAMLLSDNPLLPAFEVKLDDRGMTRVAQWVGEAQQLTDWSDVRYKTAEAQAALQAQFYRHAINLALSAAVCAAAVLVLIGLWPTALGHIERGGGGRWARSELFGAPFLAAAAGAASGCAMTALVALPLRLLTPWWSWPAPSRQALLVAGAAAVGWVLCRPAD